MDIFTESQYIRDIVKNLNAAINRTWEAEARKEGLTRPQVSVMHKLYDSPGLSLKELSHQLGMAHSTVSGILDRLEKKGLVERRTDADDRRYSRLYVTPHVDSFVKNDIPTLLNTPLVHELSRLTGDERNKIREGLAVLERAFLK